MRSLLPHHFWYHVDYILITFLCLSIYVQLHQYNGKAPRLLIFLIFFILLLLKMWIRKFWCRMKMIQEELNKVAIDQPEKKKILLYPTLRSWYQNSQMCSQLDFRLISWEGHPHSKLNTGLIIYKPVFTLWNAWEWEWVWGLEWGCVEE